MKQPKNARTQFSRDAEDISEVPKDADVGGAPRGERRKHHRIDAAQHVVVERASGRIVADLVDLSAEGARLRILNGMVPKEGEAISISLLNGTNLSGTVSWLTSRDFGVALGTKLGDVEDLVMFEDLGEAYFSKALRLQRRLQSRS